MSRLSERIENFNRAFEVFVLSVESYKKDKKNVVMHMALIQSFEVCFELGWKVLKDYLYLKGKVVTTPKDTIKEAFYADILSDGQIWIDMQNDRNTSSHEYNFDKISRIFEDISSKYFEELSRFSKWLGDINE